MEVTQNLISIPALFLHGTSPRKGGVRGVAFKRIIYNYYLFLPSRYLFFDSYAVNLSRMAYNNSFLPRHKKFFCRPCAVYGFE